MRLSKIKTKEIRYVVWKYRLKRFLPHILTLCLAVIVAGGAFSAYSVYHKKHQKQLAKQSEVQREKDVNTARKKAQKEKNNTETLVYLPQHCPCNGRACWQRLFEFHRWLLPCLSEGLSCL